MMNYALAEYQAYFIQYFYYPENCVEFKKYNYSIQDLAVLMGYTQSLEKLVFAIYQGQLSATQVKKILKDLPEKFPAEFKKIGLEERYGFEYANTLPPYLSVAIRIVANLPSHPSNAGFTALTQWVSANFVP